MSETPNGRFCWYELLTHDPDGAPAFYGAVAGWTTGVWGEGDNPYTLWMNGEVPIGGTMKLPPEAAERGAPSHWLLYISTPDVDATIAKAESLGASVMTKLEIPEVGQIAIVQDPQGAVFAAFQPDGDTPSHDGLRQLGEFSWHELMTDDWEAAWAFYSELFGWEESVRMDMGEEMGIYAMFKREGVEVGGMMNRPPDMPVSAWLAYVRVPDAHAAVETVKENGGQLIHGPIEVPGGDFVAQCVDSSGAAFAVHSVTESAEA